MSTLDRIYQTPVIEVYRHYVNKVTRKGRGESELREAMCWLTGFTDDELTHHLEGRSTFSVFFSQSRVNPAAELVTGKICGVRIEEIDDPLMRDIRRMDKLVDEIARGRPMNKVLRVPNPS